MGCESQQGRGHLSGAAGLAGWDPPPKLNFNPAHKSSSKSLPCQSTVAAVWLHWFQGPCCPSSPVVTGPKVTACFREWDGGLEIGSETHRSLTTGDSKGPGLAVWELGSSGASSQQLRSPDVCAYDCMWRLRCHSSGVIHLAL